jgi:hypothetical protein
MPVQEEKTLDVDLPVAEDKPTEKAGDLIENTEVVDS